MKIPETLGACADRLMTLKKRKERVNAVLKKIAEEWRAIEDHIIQELDKNDISGATGEHGKVKVTSTALPTPKDWEALYSYVKEHDRFDLLHKRINSRAWRDTIENGTEIPGVEVFTKIGLSLTKA